MKRTIISIVAVALSIVALSPAPAQAQAVPNTVMQVAACTGGSFFGFPPWYACLQKDASGGPKLTKLEDLWLIAIPVLESAIKFAAYAAIGFMIWAGIRFIKSQGNPGEIAGARDTIRDAMIGLIICISSVAIVQFIASRL